MNALRGAKLLIATLGVVAITAAPAAAVINASEVRAGETSQTFIQVFTSETPAFSAGPPPGLNASFSTPTEINDDDWRTTMTVSAAADIAPGAYSFPLTVSSGVGVLFTDTVSVQVLPSPGTASTAAATTTTSTTGGTTAPATTVPTTAAAATVPPSTTATVPPSTTTTVPPTTTTTVPPTTTTVAPTTAPETTSPSTTQAPSTTEVTPVTDEDTAAGPPGAVIDSSNALPLAVVVPLTAVALVAVGGLVIVAARRRRITPASQGLFHE